MVSGVAASLRRALPETCTHREFVSDSGRLQTNKPELSIHISAQQINKDQTTESRSVNLSSQEHLCRTHLTDGVWSACVHVRARVCVCVCVFLNFSQAHSLHQRKCVGLFLF